MDDNDAKRLIKYARATTTNTTLLVIIGVLLLIF